LSGQFYVAEAEHKELGLRAPVAVVTWARVSTEVDARLTESAGTPIRLRPNEWTSGEIIWLVDVVGEPTVLETSLRICAYAPFRSQVVKMVTRSNQGAPRVAFLHDLISATNEPTQDT
jgi:hemolysin-activating ACP:hemolysin acyltransferase